MDGWIDEYAPTQIVFYMFFFRLFYNFYITYIKVTGFDDLLSLE